VARAKPAAAIGVAAGYSIVELIFALGLVLTAAAVAIPQTATIVDDYRALGAARYVAGRLQRARFDAIARGTAIGIQFSASEGAYTMIPFADGNGTGILSADIRSGVDPPIGPPEHLADHFSGVDFGLVSGLPPVEPGTSAPVGDPIKLGASDILSFSSLGSSSSGSLYLHGPGARQYVIRIYGSTGKVRVMKFDRSSETWMRL
jgi:type II secretory pathway pseudopilin PulG